MQERDGIYSVLNNEDLKLIYSMTAKDGWCKFLINCCKQHIESIYGKKSDQMNTFKKEINTK